MRAPLPYNEEARLKALRRYKILESSSDESFDNITRMAASICATPVALITVIDEDRQFFKSKVGVTIEETTRDIAICAHTILRSDLLVVRDLLADDSLPDNPLVSYDPKIRS